MSFSTRTLTYKSNLVCLLQSSQNIGKLFVRSVVNPKDILVETQSVSLTQRPSFSFAKTQIDLFFHERHSHIFLDEEERKRWEDLLRVHLMRERRLSGNMGGTLRWVEWWRWIGKSIIFSSFAHPPALFGIRNTPLMTCQRKTNSPLLLEMTMGMSVRFLVWDGELKTLFPFLKK